MCFRKVNFTLALLHIFIQSLRYAKLVTCKTSDQSSIISSKRSDCLNNVVLCPAVYRCNLNPFLNWQQFMLLEISKNDVRICKLIVQLTRCS